MIFINKYKKVGLRISPNFILNELLKDSEYNNNYTNIIITDVVRECDGCIRVEAVLVDEKTNKSLNGCCNKYMFL